MFYRASMSTLLVAFSSFCLSSSLPQNNTANKTAALQPHAKVVLVTGASQGIGEAIAETFSSKEGYKVYGTTRKSKKPGIRRWGDKAGQEYELILMDPGNTLSVNTAINSIIKQYGAIDILINNAGYMVLGSVESIDPDIDLMPLFNVNVAGYMRTTAAVLPGMKKKKHGIIINITSVQAFEPRALQEAYSATRTGLTHQK